MWVLMSESNCRGGQPHGVFADKDEAIGHLRCLSSPYAHVIKFKVGVLWRENAEEVIYKHQLEE